MKVDDIMTLMKGIPSKLELGESVEKKIDTLTEELKKATDKAVEKIDHRWKITQALLVAGMVGNAIVLMFSI